SQFAVVLTGPSCLERVSPNNTGTFRIAIQNNAEEYQDVSEIVASPPLGYTYVEGSSIINGTADTQDQYSSVTTVGSSQEIHWETAAGWSVAPGGTMTIEFILI